MNVLVAYESRGGRTRRAAEALGGAVRAQGSDVTIKALGDVTASDVAQCGALAVGTWVEGFLVVGVGPAKAALAGVARLPPLDGKRAVVFCTYGLNPRGTLATLHRALEAKGATVVAESASPRAHPERGVAALAAQLAPPNAA